MLLSVCPSVAYTANIREEKLRPSVERRFPTLDATRIPVSRSKGQSQMSKIRVTRPINVDTHRAPYLPNAKAYEL